MIELIKILVDTLAKALPGLKAARDGKRRQELGVELFMLYVRFNEATLAADGIIKSLELYIDRVTYRLENGNAPSSMTAGPWVAEDVQHQIVNLARLRGLLAHRSTVLQILDTESYNRLRPLISGKLNALHELRWIMECGGLPLTPTVSDFTQLMDARSDRQSLGQPRPVIPGNPLPQWRDEAFPINSAWDSEMCGRFTEYLRKHNPRERISEIRTSLATLRATLEEHFSIGDILLDVGDRRTEIGSHSSI
ncbi:hypothetical protein ACWC24_40800 [Streptomyces sp. NPDC001443]